MAAAWEAVRGELAPSPLVACELPSPLGPQPGWLKLESFQPTGSFKVRGALSALRSLGDGSRAVSASAGNHALGMAWASGRTGVPVTVVTAENASPAKVATLQTFADRAAGSVTLVLHGQSYDEAERCARDLATTDPAAVYVSPYSDFAVIAGGATVGREVLDAVPDRPLTLVTPAGGGGLASGLALLTEEHGGLLDLVAVESSESRALSAAIEAGRLVAVRVRNTIADGLAGNLEPGAVTPDILGGAITTGSSSIVAVSDDDIGAAMRWLFATHGVVAEGAGAAGVAAVLTGQVHGRGALVVVVTGRNVTAGAYASAITEQGHS